MLTIEKLKEMQPDTIFASGIEFDDIAGINATGSGQELRWVAVRGGIWDWAIYYHESSHTNEWIKSYGDKVYAERTIRKLVECDDEAFKMYRY